MHDQKLVDLLTSGTPCLWATMRNNIFIPLILGIVNSILNVDAEACDAGIKEWKKVKVDTTNPEDSRSPTYTEVRATLSKGNKHSKTYS